MISVVQLDPSLTVVGIATRASNATPEEIGALWQSFYANGIPERIPARLSGVVYSVYFDYEGDYTAPFSTLIGCAVPADATLPNGLVQKTIPAGKYAVIDASGEQPASLVAAWGAIWKTPLDRRYDADFERHDEDGTVAIYVGVR